MQIDAKKSVPQELKPKARKVFVGGLAPEVTEGAAACRLGRAAQRSHACDLQAVWFDHAAGVLLLCSVAGQLRCCMHGLLSMTSDMPAYCPTMRAEEFRRYFGRYGTVVEAQIMQDHMSGRSRGFG